MKKEKKDILYINNETDEQMEISGYQKSIIGLVVTWFFIILTLGFLRLVFYWKPNWMLLCTHKKTNLKTATSVLLRVIIIFLLSSLFYCLFIYDNRREGELSVSGSFSLELIHFYSNNVTNK